VSFIVETHSEALINRLGNMVYENRLDKSAISLVIFEDLSEIDSSTINKRGAFRGRWRSSKLAVRFF
jgi:predicted ATPase